MQKVNLNEAKDSLYNLIVSTIRNKDSLNILTDNGEAVLVSAEKYNSLLETIYLVNIPGMVESIKKADAEPESECTPSDKVEW